MSNRRAVLSSEAETKAVPEGWNYTCAKWNVVYSFQLKSIVVSENWFKKKTYANRVDIGFVSKESLGALERPDIPQFDASIHWAGDDNVLLHFEWHGTDITDMGGCLVEFLARLQIPESNHHVSRAGHNLAICLIINQKIPLTYNELTVEIKYSLTFQEATSGKETFVAGQLASNLSCSRTITIVDVINGAHVVHATAG